MGTPISMLIPNENARPDDYQEVREKYRPSHADYTYDAKYGVRDWRGGGRTSARETAARVAAGAIARKLLRERYGVRDRGLGDQGGAPGGDRRGGRASASPGEMVDQTPIRCPDLDMAGRMIGAVEGGAQGGRLPGGRRHLRRAGLPPGVGRAGLRSPGGRPGQGDAQPPGQQGLRDRLRVRRHRPHRPGAQRPLLHGRRPGAHAHQQQRGRPGRDQQRGDDLRSGWPSSPRRR